MLPALGGRLRLDFTSSIGVVWLTVPIVIRLSHAAIYGVYGLGVSSLFTKSFFVYVLPTTT